MEVVHEAQNYVSQQRFRITETRYNRRRNMGLLSDKWSHEII